MSKQQADLSREVWRAIEVKTYLACGETKFWLMSKESNFPKPFYAGRSKLWLSKDIRAWVEARAAEARGEQ